MSHDTENVTLDFKDDMRNLVDFNGSSGKSENLHFDVLHLSKVYYLWAKKCRRVMCPLKVVKEIIVIESDDE